MPRILLIGIDGAPPALLQRWMADGELPALAELTAAGAFGSLKSTPSMTSPSAWTSIATGVNPGRHGIFSFFDREPGTWSFSQNSALSRAVEPYWLMASRAGLSTATINVPCSWPVDATSGLQVAGWLTPSDRSEGFTFPASLASELRSIYGSYPLHSDVQRLVAGGRHEAARDRIVGNLRRKAEIAEELLRRERRDLMTVVFTDTDAAAHYYWHLTDESHPLHDRRVRREVGEILLLAYREVDRAVSRLIAAAGELDAVLVVSDHGAGPACNGALYLPGLIDALGRQSRGRGPLRRLRGIAAERLPAGVKHRLAHRISARDADRTTQLLLGDVDRRRSEVLCFYQGGRSDLWLRPDLDPPLREALCSKLRETLLECRDVASGQRVISEVVAAGQLYRGPEVERSPDLLVSWREDVAPVGGLRCADAVSLRPELPPLQTGEHRPEGIFIASGDGIEPGATIEAAVEDVAPTLLHLCGLPVPSELDGSVVEDAFSRPVPVLTESTGPEGGNVSAKLTGSSPEVLDRLRGLGYLGDADSPVSRRS